MIELIEQVTSYRIVCDNCGTTAKVTMDQGTYEDPVEYWMHRGWRIMADGYTFCSDRCKGDYGVRVRA